MQFVSKRQISIIPRPVPRRLIGSQHADQLPIFPGNYRVSPETA